MFQDPQHVLYVYNAEDKRLRWIQIRHFYCVIELDRATGFFPRNVVDVLTAC